MTKTTSLLTILILTLYLTSSQTPSQQPIIGVFTQDSQQFPPFTQLKLKEQSQTYIAASYVKNLEMAGAQVIPLFYHYSQSELLDILGKINGAYFPGGSMSINQDKNWTAHTKVVVDYAKRQYDLGNIFPIWATCLGYYTVMFACTNGQTDAYNFLTGVTGEHGIVHPLIIKDSDSKLLKSFTPAQLNEATTGDGVFFFSHSWSIRPETFTKYPSWVEMFKIIATSKTSYGMEFMSILQGKKYPIFLTQFHTQKNSFEWRVEAKRSYNAISAAQRIANVFVNEARKNKNVFPLEQLKKKLIYNYQTRLLALDEYFVQVYVFEEGKLMENKEKEKEVNGKREVIEKEGKFRDI